MAEINQAVAGSSKVAPQNAVSHKKSKQIIHVSKSKEKQERNKLSINKK